MKFDVTKTWSKEFFLVPSLLHQEYEFKSWLKSRKFIQLKMIMELSSTVPILNWKNGTYNEPDINTVVWQPHNPQSILTFLDGKAQDQPSTSINT